MIFLKVPWELLDELAKEGLIRRPVRQQDRLMKRWNKLLAEELNVGQLSESREEVWKNLSGDRIFELYLESVAAESAAMEQDWDKENRGG